jgi:RNA polymerase sigma factor for flagellar operon FliA
MPVSMTTETKTKDLNTALDLESRDRLLTENLSEVHYIARRIHDRLPVQIPLEDLVHAGVIGLIDAVEKFDHTKQVKLKSYAKFRIRGAILDSLRAVDWSPRRLRKQARAVEEAFRMLSSHLGHAPSEGELAQRLGMSLSEFQKLLTELHGLSLGSLQTQTGDHTQEEEVRVYQPNGPEEDPFFQCLQGELRSLLAEAMKILEEKERQVVALYYFEELTMKEVGAALGVGESRVSQLHSLAMVRLRARLQELLQARKIAEPDLKDSEIEEQSGKNDTVAVSPSPVL